ncbi:MAG TPA: hypothetical protein VJM14_08640 [Burkholderiales bacterium]|nr:hypothetical protein [Burkholderiales bacterium]
MGRIVAAVAALAVVALVAAGVWLYLSLDHVVKRAIEKYVPEILQATVELDEVKLSPADGAGTLRGLRIGNPKGFRAPHAATVGTIALAIDPTTVVKDVVLVRRIAVERPSITYEPGAKGSNFDVLQRNVERYVGAGGDAKGGRRLIVESLIIRGARVTYAPQVGRGTATISFDLPDIQLRDVGKSRGGVTPGELAKIIVDALAARIAEVMARAAVRRGLEGVLGK